MDETAGHEITATSNTSSFTDKSVKQVGDVKKACVILADNETEDAELVRNLETMGLSVQFCNTTQVELLRNDVQTIIVQDFSSFLETRDPTLFYYGPTAIRRQIAQTPPDVKPQLPFTGHSMLTTLLLEYRCCLHVPQKSQARSRAQIYALGGRLSKIVREANLLITPCASGDAYKLARNFGLPVLKPTFIDECWKLRDDLDFMVTEDFIEKHRLQVFARLKIVFVGYEKNRDDELTERAMANGAAMADQVNRDGTFIAVVNREGWSLDENYKLNERLVPASAIVFEEWFHDSINEGYALCQNDKKYNARLVSDTSSVCSPLGRRKRGADASPGMTPKSKKSMESLLMSPRIEELSRLESSSGVFSPMTGAASPIRAEQIKDQRHLILLELRSTEANYLNVLEFIMRMVNTHLGGLDSDRKNAKQTNPAEEIITRFEKQEIFKEIPNIIALHSVLLQRIDNTLSSFEFKNISGIFHGEDACGIIPEIDVNGKTIKKRTSRKAQEKAVKENNIVAAYATFLNGLETIVEKVKTLIAENPRFAEFVKIAEDQPECNREKFLDLLIRPVQRWPSIVNILRRYSDESEKLAKKIEQRMTGGKEDSQKKKEVAQVRCGAQDAVRVRCFIENSLMQMNESKHQTAQICEALKTQSVIEDIPAMYWSKQYTLSHQCDATLIGVSESYPQTAGQKSLKNVEVVCFLFSHGLEIARKKIGKHHKPYKHVAFIHFDKMNAIIDSLDTALRRYLEIVFREQRKNYTVPETDADSVSISGGTDLAATEFSEERVLLDLKDVASKDGLLKLMEQEYKSFSRIERISMPPAIPDRKEGLRTDSLLLNLSAGNHGNTPVMQLARSLSNVPDVSTPKKLTRSFSNLIKKSFQIGNKRDEQQSTSQSPLNSTVGPLSRSRHTVSISTTSLRPRFLGALSPSSNHHRSSMSLLLRESSPENQPPAQSEENTETEGSKAKRKKLDGGFALPKGRAPISPKWVRRSLSISRKNTSSKSDNLDV